MFGTADVPLSCVMEDLQFSFDGCIPVMSLPGTRRFQCSKILGTLQVVNHTTIQIDVNDKINPIKQGVEPFQITVRVQV